MDSITQLTCSALNNVHTRPTVVFIDAVNQVSFLFLKFDQKDLYFLSGILLQFQVKYRDNSSIERIA